MYVPHQPRFNNLYRRGPEIDISIEILLSTSIDMMIPNVAYLVIKKERKNTNKGERVSQKKNKQKKLRPLCLIREDMHRAKKVLQCSPCCREYHTG